jgi:hypothetical protein
MSSQFFMGQHTANCSVFELEPEEGMSPFVSFNSFRWTHYLYTEEEEEESEDQ